MQGKIEKYIDDKGFGFIADENGDNRFFHFSEISDSSNISAGMSVSFQPGESPKGLIATAITVEG